MKEEKLMRRTNASCLIRCAPELLLPLFQNRGAWVFDGSTVRTRGGGMGWGGLK